MFKGIQKQDEDSDDDTASSKRGDASDCDSDLEDGGESPAAVHDPGTFAAEVVSSEGPCEQLQVAAPSTAPEVVTAPQPQKEMPPTQEEPSPLVDSCTPIETQAEQLPMDTTEDQDEDVAIGKGQSTDDQKKVLDMVIGLARDLGKGTESIEQQGLTSVTPVETPLSSDVTEGGAVDAEPLREHPTDPKSGPSPMEIDEGPRAPLCADEDPQ